MKLLNYIFPRYVQNLVLITTHRCNSRCVMCNIWKEERREEISLSEIKTIFDGKIFSQMENVTFSGGETMLREDFVDIVKYFIVSKKRLAGVSIATNSLAPQMILPKTAEIAKFIKDQGLKIELWLQISCDGVDERADIVRGVPGAFNRINQLINGLHELRKIYPNIKIKILFLTLPLNFDVLDKVAIYAKKKNVEYMISHLYVSEEYYNNDTNDKNLIFSSEQREKVIDFLAKRKTTGISDYYLNHLVKNMYSGIMDRGDDCIFLSPRSVFVESNGDVSLCMNSQHYKLGNIKNEPRKNFWKGKEYKKFRKDVRNNCCKDCKNNCGLNLMKFPKNLLRVYWNNFKFKHGRK